MQTPVENVALVCWKVWGGNRSTYTPVALPGLRGILYAQPKDAQRGGDLYFLSACGSGAVARLCVADFIGHGEAVADFSAALEQVFGAHIHRENPAAVLREVNRRTARKSLDMISTAICLSYNSLNGHLNFANAGHPHLLVRPAGQERWHALTLRPPVAAGPCNIPLGVESTAHYANGVHRLHPGDMILLVTDGLSEARNANGDMFGHRTRDGIVNLPVAENPERTAEAVLSALETHIGGWSNSEDDITFLVLEVLPYQKENRYSLLLRNNWRRLLARFNPPARRRRARG